MGGIKKSSEELKELYINVLSIFETLNINFILFYGSLLGYYRDSNFIEGDDDVDVLVSEEDFNEIFSNLKLIRMKNPLITFRYIGYKDKPGFYEKNFVQVYYKDIGPFDICAYTLEKNHILTAFDNLRYHIKDIFPLKQVYFKDYKINIPFNTEEILRLTYGENWRTPQKKGIDYDPHRIVDHIRDFSKTRNSQKLLSYNLPKIFIKRI